MNRKIYENFKKNSINENEVQKVKEIKIKKVLVRSAIPLILTFTIFSICALYSNKEYNYSNNYVEEQFDYDYLTVYDNLFKYLDDTKSKMYLAHILPSQSHSIEEYKLLNLTDQDIFAIYMSTTNDKDETEKAIKALGYSGWDEYLIKQDCLNKNNDPDLNLWLNRWYQKIYDDLKKVK